MLKWVVPFFFVHHFFYTLYRLNQWRFIAMTQRDHRSRIIHAVSFNGRHSEWYNAFRVTATVNDLHSSSFISNPFSVASSLSLRPATKFSISPVGTAETAVSSHGTWWIVNLPRRGTALSRSGYIPLSWCSPVKRKLPHSDTCPKCSW